MPVVLKAKAQNKFCLILFQVLLEISIASATELRITAHEGNAGSCIATSVPVDIAMPTSAAAKCGCIVHAITYHCYPMALTVFFGAWRSRIIRACIGRQNLCEHFINAERVCQRAMQQLWLSPDSMTVRICNLCNAHQSAALALVLSSSPKPNKASGNGVGSYSHQNWKQFVPPLNKAEPFLKSAANM